MTGPFVGRAMSVLVLLALLAPSSLAAIITVNGYDGDWVGLPVPASEGDEGAISQPWDINRNWFNYGRNPNNEQRYFFMVEQFEPRQFNADDFMEILINLDPGAATGTIRRGLPGVDYYLTFDLDANEYTATNTSLYKWTGAWTLVNNNVIAAWGDNPAAAPQYWVAEWELNPADIFGSNPPGFVYWAAYLDNGGPEADDVCPNGGFDEGPTPEPCTMALFGVGLMAMAGMGRRRRR